VVSGKVDPRTWLELQTCARFLALWPLVLLVRAHGPTVESLRAALVAGALLSGLVALATSLFDPGFAAHGVRGGPEHHIPFGITAVTLGFAAWLTPVDDSRGSRWSGRAALFAGLLAAALSGARTAWLAVPVLLVGSIVFAAPGVRRSRVAIAGIVFAGTLVAFVVPATGVAPRLRSLVEDVRAFGTASGHESSGGARLEMWKGAAMLFVEHPVFGVGLANYASGMAGLVKENRIRPTTEWYLDPHNELLSVAATRGLVGLAALFAVLLVAWRGFRKGLASEGPSSRAMTEAGLALVLGFAVFGLTHATSSRPFDPTLFITLVAIFHAMSTRETRA